METNRVSSAESVLLSSKRYYKVGERKRKYFKRTPFKTTKGKGGRVPLPQIRLLQDGYVTNGQY